MPANRNVASSSPLPSWRKTAVPLAFEAAVVVSAVLLAFLLNLRTALIALCALPLSLGITALWLGATGGGLDVMTLGGMAIAIGALVDDVQDYIAAGAMAIFHQSHVLPSNLQAVLIAGDKSVKYEVVLAVMDELQRQQVSKIGLLVLPAAAK